MKSFYLGVGVFLQKCLHWKFEKIYGIIFISISGKEFALPARQCLHELGTHSSPNSDTTNVYRSNKRIGGFSVTSGNASPAFQDKKTVFHQMTQSVKIFVVLALFFAVFLWRNYCFHTS